MKVIIISDTHLGVRNNNQHFISYQLDRWKELFQYAKHHGIKTVIHGGDFFDNRSSISLGVLDAARRFNKLLLDSGCDFHLLVGNHDVAFKNDNRLNSPDILLEGASVYWEEPTALKIGGIDIDLIPWINNANFEKATAFIEASKSPICIGHFEVNGAPFHKGGILCEGGIDAALFSGYNRVLSGHFHTRSKVGRVEYIGAGFDYTWADWNDQRGFVVLDTDTRELEYVNWSTFMFVMGEMHEDGKIDFTPACENVAGKYVRIVCVHESNKKIEASLRDVEAQEPADFSVFFDSTKDVNNNTVDLEDRADEMKVMRLVVDDSISDVVLRQEVNVYLEQLYREASVQ